ncbi:MAG: 4Fe-4S binding protein [Anaerolineae bacterium]|nr:4Fe-4S binding protein [Anaerolineae bacterium]
MNQPATRQRIRKALVIVSLLLFPVTMNYFSPYVIIDGAAQGILNASPLVFGLQFLSALLFGRLWCGWVCPAAGLGEVCFSINNKPVGKKTHWIKWFVWAPWLLVVGVMLIQAGGYHQVNLLHLTDSGISVDAPARYIIYYAVIGVFLALSVFVGRRAGCHTVCWMAPFMILGRKLRNLGGWPALRLKAKTDQCIQCKKCTQSCPMSLPVNAMVLQGAMEHSECILCGTCVDVCPKKVIHYSFSSGRR